MYYKARDGNRIYGETIQVPGTIFFIAIRRKWVHRPTPSVRQTEHKTQPQILDQESFLLLVYSYIFYFIYCYYLYIVCDCMCMCWLLLTLNVYSRHIPNALQLRIVYICCGFSTIICVHLGGDFWEWCKWHYKS